MATQTDLGVYCYFCATLYVYVYKVLFMDLIGKSLRHLVTHFLSSIYVHV
jgi:hypothetical protein